MDEQRDASATIVVAHAVTKLEALAIIAALVGSAVDGAGTPTPRIALAEGVWAQIDIPKFGEPPPLAVDVWSAQGAAEARRHALALAALLRERAGWSVEPAFAVEGPFGPPADD